MDKPLGLQRIAALFADALRSWWVFAIGAVLIGAVWLTVPGGGSPDVDMAVYHRTVEQMRTGADYYTAMSDAMREAGIGPASKVTSFRLPTIFVVWRWCCFSWAWALIVVLVTGVLVGIAAFPLVGLAVMLWLAAVLHPVSVEQWAFVEAWALPTLVGALVAIRADRWTVAAILALGAAVIREQAALVLVGGLAAAVVSRKPKAPWLLALGAFAGFLAWHAMQVQPFLVDAGVDIPLLGGGGVGSILAMAGPSSSVLGLAVVCWAIWRARFRPEWWAAIPILVLIPLAGTLTSRTYWGLLVLPLAAALLGEPTGEPKERISSHGMTAAQPSAG